MASPTIRLWLSLMIAFQLLGVVVAKINITYPTEGTVYPQGGPYFVQWLWESGDPNNITIYLETFDGDALVNNLRGLTWPTEDGSVTIHMSEQPPHGNTWKWAIYDTSKPIQLGNNEIAESPQFIVQGSTLPSSSTSSTPGASKTPSSTPSSHASNKLSAGAGIGVGVTLIIIVCLLIGFYFLRRSRRARNNTTHESGHGDTFPDTHPHQFSKPELDSKASANEYSSSKDDGRHQPFHAPYAAELTSNPRHELPSDMQPDGQSTPSVVPRKPLASSTSPVL